MSNEPSSLAIIDNKKSSQVLERLAFNLMLIELGLIDGKCPRQINDQIEDLIKIEKRYHRRKSELAGKRENEKRLKVTYQALLKGDIPDYPKSSLSVARLALAGWNFQYTQKAKLNEAYRNAKAKLAAKGASRPFKHDEAYLLQALAGHYCQHYGVFPIGDLGEVGGVGLDFIFNAWQVITESQITPNTLRRYLSEVKKSYASDYNR
jgi:hypothetical protein